MTQVIGLTLKTNTSHNDRDERKTKCYHVGTLESALSTVAEQRKLSYTYFITFKVTGVRLLPDDFEKFASEFDMETIEDAFKWL